MLDRSSTRMWRKTPECTQRLYIIYLLTFIYSEKACRLLTLLNAALGIDIESFVIKTWMDHFACVNERRDALSARDSNCERERFLARSSPFFCNFFQARLWNRDDGAARVCIIIVIDGKIYYGSWRQRVERLMFRGCEGWCFVLRDWQRQKMTLIIARRWALSSIFPHAFK